MVLISHMYGEQYGFWKTDFQKEGFKIVELFYKDYLTLIKRGTSVIGVYIDVGDSVRRKEIIRDREKSRIGYINRWLEDNYIMLRHKSMLRKGLFDFRLCNNYDKASVNKLISIIQNVVNKYDFS